MCVHFWKIETPNPYNPKPTLTGRCEYCHEVREFPKEPPLKLRRQVRTRERNFNQFVRSHG